MAWALHTEVARPQMGQLISIETPHWATASPNARIEEWALTSFPEKSNILPIDKQWPFIEATQKQSALIFVPFVVVEYAIEVALFTAQRNEECHLC